MVTSEKDDKEWDGEGNQGVSNVCVCHVLFLNKN